MKPSASLINTSRGGILKTQDLIQVLRMGRFRSVCLDVYEREKGLFFNNHQTSIITDEDFVQLQQFKNVLITGHQGFLTDEALTGIGETTIFNLNSWQLGGASINEVTLGTMVRL